MALKTLCATLPLLQLGHALLRDFGGYGYPDSGLGIDPRGELWQKAIEVSNASHTVRIPGYNVSKPWPGEPMDGWTISYTAIDLSRNHTELNGLPPALVSADIKIVAPKSLYVPSSNASDDGRPVVDVHPDWIFCGWRWFAPAWSTDPKKYNPEQRNGTDDGSCEPWASKECISELEKEAQTAFTMREKSFQPYGVNYTCDRIEVPESCKGTRLEDGNPGISYAGIPMKYLNGSTTWQSGWDTRDVKDSEDVLQQWAIQTKSPMPILTLFAPRGDPSKLSVDAGFAKLSCLLPAEKGPGDKSSSSGDGENKGGDDAGKGGDGDGKDEGSGAVNNVKIGTVLFAALVAAGVAY